MNLLKKPILLLYAFFLINQCFSQAVIRSTVKDEAGNPVFNANVYILESKKSTITNEDGVFYLPINPDIDKTVIISHLSYKEARFKTGSIPKTIVLKVDIFEMQEVVIGNVLTGRDIALKIIENLKNNHDTDPSYYEYFTRVASFSQDWETLNIVEEYYGKLKHTGSHNTKANIEKSRVVAYNETGKNALKKKTSIALWTIKNDNLLLFKPDFLKKGKFDNYEISLKGSKAINGIECYILKFTDDENKYKEDRRAMAFIDKNTFGIVKLISGDYYISDHNHYTERNFVKIDDKWVLSAVTTRRHNYNVTTTLYRYLTESKDYENEDFTATPFFEKLETFDKDHNDDFWENYQHIPLPE